MPELKTALRGLYRRVRLLAFAEALLLATVAVLAWALILLVVSRLTPLLNAATWLWAGSAFILCAVLTLAHLQRPTLTDAAAQADRAGYNELFSTALEFAAVDEPLVNQQRAQAIEAARSANWRQVLPWRWPRLTLLMLAGQLLAVTLLVLLPNPQTPLVEQRRLEQTVIEEQRETLETVIEEAKGPLEETEVGREVLQELAQLIQELAQAQGAQAAMGEVADLQRRLEAYQLPSGWQERFSELASNLGEGSLAQLAQEALAQGDLAALAEALAQLQANGAELTEGQQAALAELAQFAAGLGLGAEGQASLQQLLEQLGNLQGGLAAAANGQRVPPQVASGGQGQGNGQGGQGQGAGQGQGQGQNEGQGQGQGQGNNGQGQGAGVGQGEGGEGAEGAGQAGPGPAQNPGQTAGEVDLKPHELVWAPSLLGGEGQIDPVTGRPTDAQGNTIEITGGPLAPGTLRPYQEVFGQYQGEAIRSLERSDLPPEWQELVRQYFSALGGD